MTIKYFALVGVGRSVATASGLIRQIKTQTGLTWERLDGKGDWIDDPTCIDYIAGFSEKGAYELAQAIGVDTAKAVRKRLMEEYAEIYG